MIIHEILQNQVVLPLKIMSYYLGLLSGTSMDAIDAAIVDFNTHPPRLLATHAHPISDELAKETRKLASTTHITLNALGCLDRLWGESFGYAARDVLKLASLRSSDISAIGSHGQTIYHAPTTSPAFTMQIGDPNTIVAITQITTVADFRRMDVAHHGQGAPLAPLFHEYLFKDRTQDTFVLNIGGIANLTYLPQALNKPILGFDTGPGNALMDAWCRKHLKQNFDHQGAWAMQGILDENFLGHLMQDPYFQQKPPKSTGLEYFHLDWLKANLAPVDMQRTLLELTAKTIVEAILPLAENRKSQVYVCGGGANNKALLMRISALAGENFSVLRSDDAKIPADWLEAMLFAWLAKMRLEKKKVNLGAITGSSEAILLGGVYA